MEAEVLKRLDFNIMTQERSISKVRGFFLASTLDSESQNRYYEYIDNYLFFMLVEAGSRSNALLDSLVISLFYFEAQGNLSSIQTTIRVIETEFMIGPAFSKKFIRVLERSVKNLVSLGNDARSVQAIASRLTIQRYFN